MSQIDIELADEISEFYSDPFGFVMFAYPWGEKDGLLEEFDGPDVWQREGLIAIGNMVKERDFDGFRAVLPIMMAWASGHGIGKLIMCSTPSTRVIVSASNPKEAVTMEDIKWGDLKVGDYVFGKDGTPTRIVNTKTWRRPSYKVTFDDGSSLEVGAEHEWAVKGRQERRNKIDKWRVMETQEILAAGVKRPNGDAVARQWEIPTCDPVQFAHRDVYNPYAVGVWLGDGSSTSGNITSSREEIWAKLGVEPSRGTLRYKKDRVMDASPQGLSAALDSMGMKPVTCDTKFIADEYKYNSETARRELVAGMLDTDGEVHGSGSIGYSSTSKRLVDDLIWMVRSLGGKAMMQPTVKQTSYVKEGIKSTPCKPCYRCTINFGGAWNPFTHTYKRAALSDKVQDRYTKRWIESIEPIGLKYGMCIEVEAEDHLYLANDFIVTHNSCFTAWIVNWIMSTRPFSRGRLTANTGDQVRTITMPEISKWNSLSITGHWFIVNAMSVHHRAYPEKWRLDAITSREENSEAFAGLHAATSTPYYLFDEASGIPEKIWEVASGGLTDGEPMHFCFGNPTRNSGSFYECFRKNSHRWVTKQIDSRTTKMANKEYLNRMVEDFGEDSDRVRVRVRGQFPRGGDMQFIPSDVVYSAMQRGSGAYLGDDPLICGIDMARGGEDNCMIVFRRGKDAKSEKTYRIAGEKSRDSMKVVSLLIMILDRHKPDVTFMDKGSMGGPVADRMRQLGYHVIDVGFGDNAADVASFKMRTAEMGSHCRQWLLDGGAIPNDPQLELELTSREFGHNDKEQLVLERKKDMKKRLGVSPDWADALYLTFAEPVPKRELPRGHLDHNPAVRGKSQGDYNPLNAMDVDQYD